MGPPAPTSTELPTSKSCVSALEVVSESSSEPSSYRCPSSELVPRQAFAGPSVTLCARNCDPTHVHEIRSRLHSCIPMNTAALEAVG